MSCISDTEKFARRMFRIGLVLAAGMALITLYWWILWDRIWLSPVDSIEEALYGRNVTGIPLLQPGRFLYNCASVRI